MHPTPPPIADEAWSVQRVADRLHVSESTVRRLIQGHAFPGAFRVGRKLVRIPVRDLEAYQRRTRLQPAPVSSASHDGDVPLPFEEHAS